MTDGGRVRDYGQLETEAGQGEREAAVRAPGRAAATRPAHSPHGSSSEHPSVSCACQIYRAAATQRDSDSSPWGHRCGAGAGTHASHTGLGTPSLSTPSSNLQGRAESPPVSGQGVAGHIVQGRFTHRRDRELLFLARTEVHRLLKPWNACSWVRT